MAQNIMQQIKETVAIAKTFPNCFIEYNIEELPKHPKIKKKSFFGIDAKFNEKRSKNTLNIIYKLN